MATTFRASSVRLCTLLFFIGLSWSGSLRANADASITPEKLLQHFTVQPDGTFVLDVERVSLISQVRDGISNAQQTLSYNRAMDVIEVLEAFTEKADGRRVSVPASQISEQRSPALAQAPLFEDSLNKVVIFPEVAMGDRLVLRYKRHRFKPLFVGQFEDISSPPLHPAGDFSVTYDMPADMPLYTEAHGYTAVPPEARAGRMIYRWDYRSPQPARSDVEASASLDYDQYLAVSTFADYKQFAQAYQARAQVHVSPAIAELALHLTAHVATARDKTLVLSDWVRQNIRYVAVYVGAGGIVPHSAQTVLDSGYGDCKDHVALLEALLQAIGINSSPALVNLGTAYSVPSVPTLGVLNHVITYVPSLDLYLDTTDASIAAGNLPLAMLDKPVLLTTIGHFRQTPSTQLSEAVNALHPKVRAYQEPRVDARDNASGNCFSMTSVRSAPWMTSRIVW